MKFLKILILLLLPLNAFSQLVGKVVSIADGDTFTILVDNEQIKIRLHGIDCPEKAQPFGTVARQFLSDLVFGKEVIVKQLDTDHYGRTIGMVKVNDVNINEELLKAGLAWHSKYYDKNPKWAEYETTAKAQRKGLWSESNPIPPWEWRKNNKTK
jgi:micrococcal nuclease